MLAAKAADYAEFAAVYALFAFVWEGSDPVSKFPANKACYANVDETTAY